MNRKISAILIGTFLVTAFAASAPAFAASLPEEAAAYDTAYEVDGDYGGADSDWVSELREQKGMPYLRGINVCLNGEYLDFGSIAPITKDNRTMVPVRAFFEKIDADVTYEQGRISVQMEDGARLEMRLNSPLLTRVKDGETTEITMDVTPYADPASGRTYIPVRYVADVLGAEVTWDDFYEVAYINDWDGLQAEIDRNFTVVNGLLAAAQERWDESKNYNSKDKFTVSGTLYGENKDDTAIFSLTGDTYFNHAAISSDLLVDADLGGMKDTIFSELPDAVAEVIEALDGSRFQVIADLESGAFYGKGSRLSEMSGGALPNDTWLGTFLDEAEAAELQRAADPIMGRTMTVGQLIVDQARGSYWAESAYTDAVSNGRKTQLLLGDPYFTQKTNGNATTYSTQGDMLTLMSRVESLGLREEFGLSGDMTVFDLLEEAGKQPSVNYALSFTLTDGKLSGYTMTGKLKQSGTVPFELSFDLQGSRSAAKLTAAFKGTYIGKLEMRMDSAAAETVTAPLSAPASGEKVMDLEELLDGWRSAEPDSPY
ncbi:MAG: stalk domain-containing protein [Intestinibacillus sp.]